MVKAVYKAQSYLHEWDGHCIVCEYCSSVSCEGQWKEHKSLTYELQSVFCFFFFLIDFLLIVSFLFCKCNALD